MQYDSLQVSTYSGLSAVGLRESRPARSSILHPSLSNYIIGTFPKLLTKVGIQPVSTVSLSRSGIGAVVTTER
jgi:hypothetical protein